MNYLIFTIVSIISVLISLLVGSISGVIKISEKSKLYKRIEDIEPFSTKLLVLNVIVCFALSLGIQISLYKNTTMVSFIKLFVLFVIVYSAGLVDLKRRIIPNYLIIAGLIFRIGMYVYEFIVSKPLMKNVIISDLIGLGVGFGFLALVSVITKGALGFGDAKLFGIIGIISGSFCTYSTLLLSLVASVIVSVIGLVTKKMNKKDSMPFGPCIAVGYIAALLLTSY